jgi:hypothetical protein
MASDNGKNGSGGGAGGSIKLVMNSVAGNGIIDVSGGDGSVGGGGGGSGGRKVVHFLKSFIAEEQRLKSFNWNGTLIRNGGQAG